MTGKIYKHIKRGTLYQIVEFGSLQSSEEPGVDGWTVVIYKSLDDEAVYVRELTEFFDGRFEVIEIEP